MELQRQVGAQANQLEEQKLTNNLIVSTLDQILDASTKKSMSQLRVARLQLLLRAVHEQNIPTESAPSITASITAERHSWVRPLELADGIKGVTLWQIIQVSAQGQDILCTVKGDWGRINRDIKFVKTVLKDDYESLQRDTAPSDRASQG